MEDKELYIAGGHTIQVKNGPADPLPPAMVAMGPCGHVAIFNQPGPDGALKCAICAATEQLISRIQSWIFWGWWEPSVAALQLPQPSSCVLIEAVKHRGKENTRQWAIRCGDFCLRKDGSWQRETWGWMSNEEGLRHRYETFQEAVNFATATIQIVPIDLDDVAALATDSVDALSMLRVGDRVKIGADVRAETGLDSEACVTQIAYSEQSESISVISPKVQEVPWSQVPLHTVIWIGKISMFGSEIARIKSKPVQA